MATKPIDGLALAFADVNDVSIHYAHLGDGGLMLFVHGWPRHWYLWRNQLSDFGRDHHAVALDLRGYNLSSKPEGDQNYSVRHNVEDIRALADHLAYDRFTLVGHDIGGGAAFALSASTARSVTSSGRGSRQPCRRDRPGAPASRSGGRLP